MISALFAQYRLYVYGAALLAAISLVLWYGHTRHAAGVRVTTEHYEAILASQAAALAAANQKTHDADVRADEITKRMQADAEKSIVDVMAERDAAIFSLRDYQSRTRAKPVPQVAGPAGGIDAATISRLAQCDRNNEASLDDAADRQLNAQRRLELQQWYRAQQAAHTG